jgi:hypothetical protein
MAIPCALSRAISASMSSTTKHTWLKPTFSSRSMFGSGERLRVPVAEELHLEPRRDAA